MDVLNIPVAAIVLTVIGTLALSFVALSVWPAVRVGRRLSRARREIKDLKSPSIDDVDAIFAKAGPLQILWREYRGTVHQQREFNPESGTFEPVKFRSTAPADFVFRPEAVVDYPLHLEFFKHMPGVCTGLGIIGTFIGLIRGLHLFSVSDNPAVVRQSLNSLMTSVHDAFVVSAGAILVAVATTIVEKVVVSRLYGSLNDLNSSLDRLYEPGIGEEYLERLARSSESSLKDAKILKDALVHDLELILERVSSRQIDEASRQTEAIQKGIMAGLREGLGEPIDRLAVVAEKMSGNQVEAVNTLLTDTLTHFSAQLRELFDSQLSATGDAQRELVTSMRETLASLSDLGSRLGDVGASAGASIADSVQRALLDIEAQQAAMRESMAGLLVQMGASLETSALKSADSVTSSVTALARHVSELVGSLQGQVASAAARDQERADKQERLLEATHRGLSGAIEAQQAAMRESIAGMVTQMGASLETSAQKTTDGVTSSIAALSERVVALVGSLQSQVTSGAARELERADKQERLLDAAHKELSGAIESTAQLITALSDDLRTTVAAFQQVSVEASQRFALSVGKLQEATTQFARAGEGTAHVLEEARSLSTQLTASASAVSVASNSLGGLVTSYDSIRAEVNTLIGQLQEAVASARRDSVSSSQLVERLEAATTALVAAQREADAYLGQVSQVLIRAFDEFQGNVERSLRGGNREFHEQLSAAVRLLRGNVEELGEALSRVPLAS